MIKVSEPIHLTAGKIFPVTMAMFSTVRYQISIYIILVLYSDSIDFRIAAYDI